MKYRNDRFIPKRLTENEMQVAHQKLVSDTKPNVSPYVQDILNVSMFGKNGINLLNKPILTFGEKKGLNITRKLLDPNPLEELSKPKPSAQFDMKMTSVSYLKRPNRMANDYYTSLLSWGDIGCVYIGLNSGLYAYNHQSNLYDKFEDVTAVGNQSFSCVGAMHNASQVLAAKYYGDVYYYDCSTSKLIVNQTIHEGTDFEGYHAVSFVQYDTNICYLGDRVGFLHTLDSRTPKLVTKIMSPLQDNLQIAGLSFNNKNHIATGHDCTAMIWDVRNFSKPVVTDKSHKAFVGALAFHPTDPNVIATGGGSADKKIKVWDWSLNQLVAETETQSQICGLYWHDNKHLLSAYGYLSNKLEMHEVDTYRQKIKPLESTSPFGNRVLQLARNPKNEAEYMTAVTGTKPQQLHFWNINKRPKQVAEEKSVFKPAPLR